MPDLNAADPNAQVLPVDAGTPPVDAGGNVVEPVDTGAGDKQPTDETAAARAERDAAKQARRDAEAALDEARQRIEALESSETELEATRAQLLQLQSDTKTERERGLRATLQGRFPGLSDAQTDTLLRAASIDFGDAYDETEALTAMQNAVDLFREILDGQRPHKLTLLGHKIEVPPRHPRISNADPPAGPRSSSAI
jgi:hypothetical protein